MVSLDRCYTSFASLAAMALCWPSAALADADDFPAGSPDTRAAEGISLIRPGMTEEQVNRLLQDKVAYSAFGPEERFAVEVRKARARARGEAFVEYGYPSFYLKARAVVYYHEGKAVSVHRLPAADLVSLIHPGMTQNEVNHLLHERPVDFGHPDRPDYYQKAGVTVRYSALDLTGRVITVDRWQSSPHKPKK